MKRVLPAICLVLFGCAPAPTAIAPPPELPPIAAPPEVPLPTSTPAPPPAPPPDCSVGEFWFCNKDGSVAQRIETVKHAHRCVRDQGDVARANALAGLTICPLADDADLRSEITKALIDADLVDEPSARLLPSAAAATTEIRRLAPKSPAFASVDSASCSLSPRRASGRIELACKARRCGPGACMMSVGTMSFRIEVSGWTLLASHAETKASDGSCGDCD